MAKDLYHEHVRNALIAAGWSITHDPYKISVQESTAEVDLGAEKLIGAKKDNLTIAVEIKSFLRESKFYDFHAALGQYMVYLVGLERTDPTRRLILAIPKDAYGSLSENALFKLTIDAYQPALLIFDPDDINNLQWIMRKVWKR